MAGTFQTKVSRAMKGSPTVRTTIPAAIAGLLGVDHGSTVVWTIESGTGRVWVSAVEPPKKKSSK